jgi:sulfonate transport system permease protein
MTSKSKNLPLELPAPRRASVSLHNAWRLRLKGLVLPVLIVLLLEFVVRIGWLPRAGLRRVGGVEP